MTASSENEVLLCIYKTKCRKGRQKWIRNATSAGKTTFEASERDGKQKIQSVGMLQPVTSATSFLMSYSNCRCVLSQLFRSSGCFTHVLLTGHLCSPSQHRFPENYFRLKKTKRLLNKTNRLTAFASLDLDGREGKKMSPPLSLPTRPQSRSTSGQDTHNLPQVFSKPLTHFSCSLAIWCLTAAKQPHQQATIKKKPTQLTWEPILAQAS